MLRVPRARAEIWPPLVRLYNFVLLVGFSAVLALARGNQIDLRAPRLERAGILALYSEQKKL